MPEVIEKNVSLAWLKAVKLADSCPRKEISNFILTIEDLNAEDELEISDVRTLLDKSLVANEKFSVDTVANTIFPSSLWRRNEPRDLLFERYRRLWPRIVSHRRNRRGTYFQRLIDYPGAKGQPFNQLEHVISAYKSGIRRRSALQCGILAPNIDLNATPFQGFPCMQQLALIPEGEGLRITALYPMHYLWARAYGNYLGLINLGRFMANEMSLELLSMTCIALVAKFEEPKVAAPFVEAAIAI